MTGGVDRTHLTLLLTFLSALGPLSVDLYLPAFPSIADDLAATPSAVQFTLGAYLAGFAIMQLVAGPLADRFGRKPVLLAGMLLFIAASLLCAVSPSIEWLVASRFLQAVGGAAAPVVTRAIVRDLYAGRDAGRILGYLASAMAIAPLVAPTIGGYLDAWFGWQSTFHFLTAIGLILFFWIWRRYEETLDAPVKDALDALPFIRYCALLLRHKLFLGYTLAVGFSFGLLFSWVSNAPHVIIEFFGVDSRHFGVFFAIGVLGYSAGAYAGGRLVQRLGIPGTVLLGVTLFVSASTPMLLLSLLDASRLALIMPLIAVAMIGTSMAVPQGMAGAMVPFPRIAGIASALIGFTQMLFAITVNILSSLFFDGSDRPMTYLMTICAVFALVAYFVLISPDTHAKRERQSPP